MPTAVQHPSFAPSPVEAAYEHRVYARTHRFFRALLGAQAVSGLALAALLHAPHAWLVAGLAAVAGTIPAFWLMRSQPYTSLTRVAVAVSQASFSLALIYLSGGRFETHCHAFASLAFVAFYCDWKLPATAFLVIAAHHLVGAPAWLIPGGKVPNVFEHGAWLAFESVLLGWACVVARREMHAFCESQVQHQNLLAELEQRVRERTKALEAEIAEREKTAAALRGSEQQHREMIARLPIGVFETTRSGRVRFANPHALGLVGLPGHIDPTSATMSDGRIFPVTMREELWRRLEAHGEVRGFQTIFRHFDGSPFDVVINARLKATPPGEELAAEGTLEDVSLRKRAERELETLHSQLVLASRQAGMAEVATGVLHNVGNVLTSVNLIVHDVQDRLRASRISHLHKVVEILQRERDRLPHYLTQDPTGRQVPEFLAQLDTFLTRENEQLISDVDGLVRHFEHIREIIVTQQGSAQMYGIIEMLEPAQLVEDALRLTAESRARHGIELQRDLAAVGRVRADRHKVLQILVNLMRNAKDALQQRERAKRKLRVSVAAAGPDRISISVEDNGAGVAPENLTRIFQHGYTTKATGHGFGLHSSVLAAREMHGDLTASSAGVGQGAVFTLTLPAAPLQT